MCLESRECRVRRRNSKHNKFEGSDGTTRSVWREVWGETLSCWRKSSMKVEAAGRKIKLVAERLLLISQKMQAKNLHRLQAEKVQISINIQIPIGGCRLSLTNKEKFSTFIAFFSACIFRSTWKWVFNLWWRERHVQKFVKRERSYILCFRWFEVSDNTLFLYVYAKVGVVKQFDVVDKFITTTRYDARENFCNSNRLQLHSLMSEKLKDLIGRAIERHLKKYANFYDRSRGHSHRQHIIEMVEMAGLKSWSRR